MLQAFTNAVERRGSMLFPLKGKESLRQSRNSTLSVSSEEAASNNNLLLQSPKSTSAENAKSLGNHGMLQGRDPAFLEVLSEELAMELFLEGDTIISEGEKGANLFLLRSGSVEVLVEKGTKRLTVLKNGSIFGEMALLHAGARRTATVRALEFCDCRVIGYKAFKLILNKFPAEKQYFDELARERSKSTGAKVVPQAVKEEDEEDVSSKRRASSDGDSYDEDGEAWWQAQGHLPIVQRASSPNVGPNVALLPPDESGTPKEHLAVQLLTFGQLPSTAASTPTSPGPWVDNTPKRLLSLGPAQPEQDASKKAEVAQHRLSGILPMQQVASPHRLSGIASFASSPSSSVAGCGTPTARGVVLPLPPIAQASPPSAQLHLPLETIMASQEEEDADAPSLALSANSDGEEEEEDQQQQQQQQQQSSFGSRPRPTALSSPSDAGGRSSLDGSPTRGRSSLDASPTRRGSGGETPEQRNSLLVPGTPKRRSSSPKNQPRRGGSGARCHAIQVAASFFEERLMSKSSFGGSSSDDEQAAAKAAASASAAAPATPSDCGASDDNSSAVGGASSVKGADCATGVASPASAVEAAEAESQMYAQDPNEPSPEVMALFDVLLARGHGLPSAPASPAAPAAPARAPASTSVMTFASSGVSPERSLTAALRRRRVRPLVPRTVQRTRPKAMPLSAFYDQNRSYSEEPISVQLLCDAVAAVEESIGAFPAAACGLVRPPPRYRAS
eukprot:TRINITY_DN4865_c0_g1_i2.p1 TRINITY_DN4865_c0_g1~~TRINITY_DN4865_c0_g1_i2.p1  ORF type:complete len:732 (-),score=201.27 TRINITY_DN4865_c0_g1_i2:92-2287(-)